MAVEGQALADSDAALWDTAREAALELPGSEISPFAEDWDAARVRGKWFMISTIRDTRIVNLKASPEDVRALTEVYPSITPGYHMSKKHWITLRPGKDLTVAMVRELVVESYLLVVAGLPRSRRPVDPERWGGR